MKPGRPFGITSLVSAIKRAVSSPIFSAHADASTEGRHNLLLTRGIQVLVLAGIIVGASLIAASTRDKQESQAASTTVREAPSFTRGADGQIDVPPGSPLRQQLVIGPVAVENVAQTLDLPATVEADPARTAKVAPPLSGRIAELRVGVNDDVEKGQVVAILNSADLAQAYDDFDKAQSALALARRGLDRQRGLTAIRAGAGKDMEAAQDTFTQAEAEARRTAERLDQIGAPTTGRRNRGALLNITAPFSGVVTDLSAARGTYFNDPTQSLMTISQLDVVWVMASVPEKDLAFVSLGQAVEVRFLAYPGEIFRGTVARIGDTVDTDTRRTKVRIEFNNPDHRLKPGMFASVRLIAPPKSIATIPATALVLKNDTDSVFIETSPWHFEIRQVRTQNSFGDQVAVTQGLAASDRVVVKGGYFLND